MKFNSSGGVVWQNLNADGNQNLLLHSQLLLDNRNNAYLAAGTLFQMAVCKVNADGTDGWLYLGSGNSASAIAAGPAGRIYATGLNTVQLSQPHQTLPVRLELEKTGGITPSRSSARSGGPIKWRCRMIWSPGSPCGGHADDWQEGLRGPGIGRQASTVLSSVTGGLRRVILHPQEAGYLTPPRQASSGIGKALRECLP